MEDHGFGSVAVGNGLATTDNCESDMIVDESCRCGLMALGGRNYATFS